MHKLYELAEKLCKELEQYSSGEITASTLEYIDTLAHAAKNVGKLIEQKQEMEEYSQSDGYSRRGGGSYYGRRAYEDGGSMRGGNSYAHGRGSNAKRDSMGRYSSGRYSRDGGYSRGGGDGMTVQELYKLLDKAQNDMERQLIEQCISDMENA